MKRRKGVVYAITFVLVLMFVFMLLYNIFSYPLSETQDQMEAHINDTNSSLATRALETIDTIEITWEHWPIFLLFMLFLWVLIAAQRSGLWGG